ncbi:hypothetical protein [Novipirellula galeiformis]|nr:hypothetical protein [Novipirellula galeiformis]
MPRIASSTMLDPAEVLGTVPRGTPRPTGFTSAARIAGAKSRATWTQMNSPLALQPGLPNH